MLYPQEIIDQVIDSNSIVDVISEYVKLTKKGSTYFGLCPFHNEKTPSFSVTDNGDRRMFYCFGCHSGGNVVTFLMKHDGLTYTEALKVLAERAGIKLPEPTYNKEDAARNRLREQVLEVYREAAVYYFHLLKSERGRQAYSYLKKRELSDETIMKFGLGYSDKYRDDLYRYVKGKGYSDEVLKATGLFSIRETDIHDYFWNRVMFPIMDTRNKVIAFGGRVMGDGEPKYLNSPETIVFEKRKNLFGLHIARKHKGQELILCEGYMDVISLHQAGFTNAVASLGTALTPGHTGVLKRYTSQVVLSYDSDAAGRNAALRAIPILRDAGIRARVINLSPYKDPDELIKKEGPESYRQRLQTARNSLLFEIDVLKESFDLNDPDSRTGFYNETARRLSRLDDEIERENYLQTISREYGIEYSLLRSRTIRYALNQTGTAALEPVRSRASQKTDKQTALLESQKTILSYLALHPSFYERIRKVLTEKDFEGSLYHTAAVLLFSQISQGKINVSGIIGAYELEEQQEEIAAVFREGPENVPVQDYAKLLNECVINIKRNALEQQITQEKDLARVLLLRKEQEKLGQLKLSE